MGVYICKTETEREVSEREIEREREFVLGYEKIQGYQKIFKKLISMRKKAH